jgi:hypothetical protein
MPIHWSLRQEEFEFKAILSYIARPSLKKRRARSRWLTPVIPATQEAEIRRITVQIHPRQIVCETLSEK